MKAEDESTYAGKFYLKDQVYQARNRWNLRVLRLPNLNIASKIAFWAAHLFCGESALEMLIEVTHWGVESPVELTFKSGMLKN